MYESKEHNKTTKTNNIIWKQKHVVIKNKTKNKIKTKKKAKPKLKQNNRKHTNKHTQKTQTETYLIEQYKKNRK